jgi:hypothetical protein
MTWIILAVVIVLGIVGALVAMADMNGDYDE